MLALSLSSRPALAEEGTVRVRAVPEFEALAQGSTIRIAFVMDHGPKFHTWPDASVKLPETLDFAIRTDLALGKVGNPSFTLSGVVYPKTKLGNVPDPNDAAGTKKLQVPLFSGKAVGYAFVKVADSVPLGSLKIPLVLSYQACDDAMCLPPEDAAMEVVVRIIAKGSSDVGPAKDPELFANAPSSAASQSTQGTPNQSGTTATSPAAAPQAGSQNLFGIALGGGAIILFLVSMVGGFALNLTPCVLPVIPIKILTLTKHAGSRSRSIVLGLWMALGVVCFWTAAGVPMAFVSSALDPSKYIFGVWWMSLIVGLIVAALGFGIMGAFNINLPNAVYAIEPKADSASGSFMFGVMAGVLGLPCFGFVAGGLLAGAAALPWYTIMAIFVGIGLGMGLPYLVFSIWPQLLKFIPKTGPASDLVKQIMGLLLMAAAAFFVAAGLKALLTDYPHLAKSVGWWAVSFFVLIAVLWMIYRTFQISGKALHRGLSIMLGIPMVGGVVALALALSAMDTWRPYSSELLKSSLAANKVVVVDFTADWCINCKVLKKTVLESASVEAALKSHDAVLIEVDLTSKNAPGWQVLKDLGQTGIPTLAIYGPGARTPLIHNAYTAGVVVESLGKASGTVQSAGLSEPAAQTSPSLLPTPVSVAP